MSNSKDMNCSSIRALLSSYIDNELTDAENVAVTEHISSCESCKKLLSDMYKVQDMVKSVYAPKGDVDFSSKIMANIKHRKPYGAVSAVDDKVLDKENIKRGRRSTKRSIGSILMGKFVFSTVAAAAVLFAIGSTVVYFENSSVNKEISETFVAAQMQNKQDKLDNKFEDFVLEHYANSFEGPNAQASVLSVNFE